MKTAARKLLLLLLVSLLGPATLRAADALSAGPSAEPSAGPSTSPAPPSASVPPPAATGRDLLAHGTDQYYWAADIAPTADLRAPGIHTLIRFRAAGDVEWREIAEFAAPATALANRGSELLVVLAGGNWSIVSASDTGGVRSGVPLPGDAKVFDLAGDGDDVWAIAAAPAGKMLPPPAPQDTTTTPAAISTTASTTISATSATATTTSTTASTVASLPPHDLALFRLHQGKWAEQDLLPNRIGRDDLHAWSMAVVDGRLMLALASGLDVRVYTHGPQGWDGGADVAVLAANSDIKLINLFGRPALWMFDPAGGPGSLFVHEQRWSGPRKLVPSPKLVNYDRRALVVALGRMRMLASDARGRLAEQFYKPDGSLEGPATEAVTIPRGRDERLAQGLQVLVLVILLVWMMGSLRQRPALREAVGRADQLHIAPLNRRLLGGLIDLIPFVAALLIAEIIERRSSQPVSGRLTYQSPEFAWLAAGVGLYLLLPTLFELLLGRSIGKLLAGTRVAALNGSRPAPAAVLIRNLLRLVDLIMLLCPLGLILFSPLKQRIGDMAAGTIVVMNDAEQPPPSSER